MIYTDVLHPIFGSRMSGKLRKFKSCVLYVEQYVLERKRNEILKITGR